MAAKLAYSFLNSLTPLFYLKTPSSSSFKEINEIPNYLLEVVPNFFLLMFIEAIVRSFQGKTLPRANDAIGSISAGIFMQLTSALTGAFEITSYIWMYKNFQLISLPWDSSFTWWLAFIMQDFIFYWFHRMAHEVNIFWMAHQVHHSSEEYNLSTALRQSLLQRFTSWFFYLPLAIAIPPTAYIVHKQLNLLYQFWIHTEVVGSLGPLEWVLNTPSHHRVHHGRNPYCIDKNYGGVLIIWDRVFGTFAPESDKVVYGIIPPLTTWNPIWIQFHKLVYVVNTIGQQLGWKNKIYFLVYGPGWGPGKPRLGCFEDIPEVSVNEKPYNKYTPWWLNVYCVLHFIVILVFFTELEKVKITLPFFTLLAAALYIMYSLTVFGLMFDCRIVSSLFEVLRVAIFIATELSFGISQELHWSLAVSLRFLMLFSIGLWTIISIKNYPKHWL